MEDWDFDRDVKGSWSGLGGDLLDDVKDFSVVDCSFKNRLSMMGLLRWISGLALHSSIRTLRAWVLQSLVIRTQTLTAHRWQSRETLLVTHRRGEASSKWGAIASFGLFLSPTLSTESFDFLVLVQTQLLLPPVCPLALPRRSQPLAHIVRPVVGIYRIRNRRNVHVREVSGPMQERLFLLHDLLKVFSQSHQWIFLWFIQLCPSCL